MKTHRKIIAILLLCGLALCACGGPQGGESSDASVGVSGDSGDSLDSLESAGTSSENTENTEPSAESSDSSSGESSTATEEEIARYAQYFVPRPEGSGLIDYDPDRTIYFSCQNWDFDYYVETATQRTMWFYILSLEQLDVDEISFTLPIQTGYTTQVLDDSDLSFQKTELTPPEGNGLSFPLFLAYKEIDFQRFNQLADQTDLAVELYEAGEITEEEEEAMLDEYWDLFHAYRDEFEAMPTEVLPKFYVYLLSFTVDDEALVEESFRYIDFQIGDTSYRQEIGEVRIHTDSIPTSKEKGIGILSMDVRKDCGLYTDVVSSGIAEFRTEANITVKDLYEYTGKEMVSANVKIFLSYEDQRAGENPLLNFNWDMKTPFRVEEGRFVQIETFYRDERLKQLEYGGMVYICMDYVCEGEDCMEVLDSVFLCRESDSVLGSNWTRYALVFSGLDLRALNGIYE